MMNTLKTEQYQEARDRLDTLDSVFTLSPSLINQWEIVLFLSHPIGWNFSSN